MGEHSGKHGASHAAHTSSRTHKKARYTFIPVIICIALIGVVAAVYTGTLSFPSDTSPASETTENTSNSNANQTVRDPEAENDAAATDDQAEEQSSNEDTTPLETGADAAISTSTTPGGVAVTAPDGFLATPSCKRVDQAVATLQESGYNLGFVMLDLTNGRGMSYNADERLYPASSIKAAYCTMVMENNGGSAGMASTIEDCLVNSSNDAFHTLIDTFGLSSYGSWLETHGAPQAGSDAYVYYYPWISANELSAIWQEIWRYGTSGEPGGSELGSYLARTNHSAMGDLLRDSYEVWSKPGWYPADGSGLEATVDAGVVFSDCGPYVLIVMSNASEDFDALLPLIDALNAAHGKMCGGSSVLLMR